MKKVDEYLEKVSEPQRVALERIRTIVRTLVPEAEETFSYMMPAFKYKHKPLLYYAAFTHHMSIFPTSGPTATLKDRLSDFAVSKGTIQFTLDHPLPDALLQEILACRIEEINGK